MWVTPKAPQTVVEHVTHFGTRQWLLGYNSKYLWSGASFRRNRVHYFWNSKSAKPGSIHETYGYV